ncbi:MAG: hypothetical protein K9J13_13845 [Saprospiraceae bacterium]|nr:hypothetical protein [Saprospiraceae bacterium]
MGLFKTIGNVISNGANAVGNVISNGANAVIKLPTQLLDHRQTMKSMKYQNKADRREARGERAINRQDTRVTKRGYKLESDIAAYQNGIDPNQYKIGMASSISQILGNIGMMAAGGSGAMAGSGLLSQLFGANNGTQPVPNSDGSKIQWYIQQYWWIAVILGVLFYFSQKK